MFLRWDGERPTRRELFSIHLHKLAATCGCLLLASVMNAQISITSYGAIPDGVTDNAPAITTAFAYAAAHQGTKITFPCSTGNTYKIKSPLRIPPFTTLEGDNSLRCDIVYDPSTYPGNVTAAFNFVGSGFDTVHNLRLRTGSTYPPNSIVAMGRLTGNPNGGGQHVLDNVSVQGYASKAMIYAISSETTHWSNLYIERDGGGASYGLYLGGADDLMACAACTSASNLSVYVDHFNIVDLAAGPFAGIGDAIGGGTGDHYLHDGYVGLNSDPGSAGVTLISGNSSQGGPNTNIDVSNIRIENGGYGAYLKLNQQTSISNVNIHGLTWASSSTGHMFYGDTGLALWDFTMQGNVGNGNNGITAPSSFDTLRESYVDEHYGQITVRSSAIDNTMIVRGNAALVMPLNCSGNAISAKGIWSTK